MDFEYTFFDLEPKEITAFIKNEFAKDHYDHTKTIRKPYSYCVKSNNVIIAAGRGSIFGSDCNITEIIINEEYRNKGLGKKILGKIEDLAKKSNCSRIMVDTYQYQAPNFYLKNGFIEIERIENYRNEYARIFFEKKI